MPDPLLVLTQDRGLTYANQAARDTLGNELSAVLRHPTLRAAIDRVQAAEAATESVDLLLPVPMPRDLHATVIDLGAGSPRARTALLLAIAPAHGRWSGCAPTSSPTRVTNCAPH